MLFFLPPCISFIPCSLPWSGRGVRKPYLPKGMQEFVPNIGKPKDNVEFRPAPNDDDWEVRPNQSKDKSVLIDLPVWLVLNSNKPYEREFIPEMVPELIVPDLEGFQVRYFKGSTTSCSRSNQTGSYFFYSRSLAH